MRIAGTIGMPGVRGTVAQSPAEVPVRQPERGSVRFGGSDRRVVLKGLDKPLLERFQARMESLSRIPEPEYSDVLGIYRGHRGFEVYLNEDERAYLRLSSKPGSYDVTLHFKPVEGCISTVFRIDSKGRFQIPEYMMEYYKNFDHRYEDVHRAFTERIREVLDVLDEKIPEPETFIRPNKGQRVDFMWKPEYPGVFVEEWLRSDHLRQRRGEQMPWREEIKRPGSLLGRIALRLLGIE